MSTPSLKSRAMFLFGRDSGTVSTHAYRSCIILVRYLRGSVGMRTDPALYSASSRYTRQNGVHVWLLPFFCTCIHAYKFNMTLPYACCLSHTHIYTFSICVVCLCVCICVWCRECCVCELSMCVWDTSTRLAYLYIIFRIPDSHAKRALKTHHRVAFCWVCKCSSLSFFGALSLFRTHTKFFCLSLSLLPLRSFCEFFSLHFIFDSKSFFLKRYFSLIFRWEDRFKVARGSGTMEQREKHPRNESFTHQEMNKMSAKQPQRRPDLGDGKDYPLDSFIEFYGEISFSFWKKEFKVLVT